MRGSLILSGLALAVSSPAFAQVSDSDDGTVSVEAQVAPLCVLGEPTPAVVNLGSIAATAGLRVGRITALSDQLVSLPDSFCNFAGSAITIEVQALLEEGSTSAPDNFSRAVNYTASLDGWASVPASATSASPADGSAATVLGIGGVQTLPRQADLEVTLTNFTVPADQRLVAGNYAGTVRVTLGPAAISE